MTDAASGSADEPLAPGRRLAMFPLGTVLLPTMWLPLRVFEPRYQQLVHDVTAADRCFGVVMIERGSEVGGGDVRSGVGCLARVVQAEPLGGGQWGLMCVGTERLRVVEWLDDDPYPRAVVDPWPEDAAAELDLQGLVERLHRVRALVSSLGVAEADEPVELAPDPVTALYQIALAAPLGPLDRYRLLATPRSAERIDRLTEQLDDLEVMLRARIDDA